MVGYKYNRTGGKVRFGKKISHAGHEVLSRRRKVSGRTYCRDFEGGKPEGPYRGVLFLSRQFQAELLTLVEIEITPRFSDRARRMSDSICL